MISKKENLSIQSSFPICIRPEIINLLENLTIHSQHSILGHFPVWMNGERLEIPGRIYWEEHRLMESKSLNTEQLLALSCILTRHHNGYIRQKHLQYIIDSNLDWTIPYIVQLLGEYIIEIIQVLYTRFDQINKSNLKRFIQDNPFFWDLTKSRVISYWDCYYRKKSPGQVTGFLKNDYPGFKVIDKIEGLLNI